MSILHSTDWPADAFKMDAKPPIAPNEELSQVAQEKQQAAPTANEADNVEIASLNEPEKGYYSKLSV
jgi:hypothetical protein